MAVGHLPTKCLSVFGHFMRFTHKWLNVPINSFSSDTILSSLMLFCSWQVLLKNVFICDNTIVSILLKYVFMHFLQREIHLRCSVSNVVFFQKLFLNLLLVFSFHIAFLIFLFKSGGWFPSTTYKKRSEIIKES